jgi:hypothetical protein
VGLRPATHIMSTFVCLAIVPYVAWFRTQFIYRDRDRLQLECNQNDTKSLRFISPQLRYKKTVHVVSLWPKGQGVGVGINGRA